MRFLLPLIMALIPAGGFADSCVTLRGTTLVNQCRTCMDVTTRALNPPEQHDSAGVFAAEPQATRLKPGGSAVLAGATRVAIVDLKACK